MFEFIIIISSIVFSAFFSGTEIAFVSMSRMQVELEKKKNQFLSRLFIFFYEHPKQFISTLLIGNTICLVVFGYYAGNVFNRWILDCFNSINSGFFWLIQTIVFTIIILITAEYLPKAIFSTNPYKYFKLFLIPSFFFYILIYPFVSIVNGLTNLLIYLFKINDQQENNIFFKEEMSYFISEKLEEVNDKKVDSEIQIFKNALGFSGLKARDCMIPRKEIIAFAINDSVNKIKQKFIDTGFSKLIIYKGNIDRIIGYVHVFDMFKKPKDIGRILLPVEMIHEMTSVREIMNLLTRKKRSIAVVLDEYGGTSGMLTTEDLVEELFGNIEDEHDKLNFIEKKISDTEYLFSARLEIDYLNQQYHLNIEESETYETLGGFIYSYLENIPEKGESFENQNLKFIIEKASKTRIEEVRVFILNS